MTTFHRVIGGKIAHRALPGRPMISPRYPWMIRPVRRKLHGLGQDNPYAEYGFEPAEVGTGGAIFKALNHFLRGGSWTNITAAVGGADLLNWEDTRWGKVWASQGGGAKSGAYFDSLPKIKQGDILRELVGTPSRSDEKRKKLVKTTAAVGALVAGGLFLGPKIAAAVKGISTGKDGKQIPSGIESTATDKVVTAINTARTVDAIKDGEIPPPPVSVQGSNFTDWAMAIANQNLQNRTSDQEKELMRQEITRLQTQVDSAVRTSSVPITMTPSPLVPIPVQQIQEASQISSANTMNMMILGAFGLIMVTLLLGGKK